MPFLRFSRDARGYESTYLCHTYRRSTGPQELRVLYWFRSPPDVKVGRTALDPDIIRAIEDNNPDLRFDWDKILKVKPPPPPDPGREAREDRRRRRQLEATASPSVDAETPDAPTPDEPVETISEPSADSSAAPAVSAPDIGGSAWDDEPGQTAAAAGGSEGGDGPLRHVALAFTDEEGLVRLRARHAEIQTRIGDRFRDPARMEELRSRAAVLDPDGWRTVDEARERMAALEETTAALRKILGRRRRTRRGGGRPRRPASDEATPASDAATPKTDPGESSD